MLSFSHAWCMHMENFHVHAWCMHMENLLVWGCGVQWKNVYHLLKTLRRRSCDVDTPCVSCSGINFLSCCNVSNVGKILRSGMDSSHTNGTGSGMEVNVHIAMVLMPTHDIVVGIGKTWSASGTLSAAFVFCDCFWSVYIRNRLRNSMPKCLQLSRKQLCNKRNLNTCGCILWCFIWVFACHCRHLLLTGKRLDCFPFMVIHGKTLVGMLSYFI